jgi:hypothetical protein
MILNNLLAGLLLFITAAHAAAPPVFIPNNFTNPPFIGTRIPNAGLRGWLERAKNNVLVLDFKAGRGGMGVVSTKRMLPGMASCAKLSFPSPTYGELILKQMQSCLLAMTKTGQIIFTGGVNMAFYVSHVPTTALNCTN